MTRYTCPTDVIQAQQITLDLQQDLIKRLRAELMLFLAGDPVDIAGWVQTHRSEVAGEIASELLAAVQRQRMRAHAVTAATVPDDFVIVN